MSLLSDQAKGIRRLRGRMEQGGMKLDDFKAEMALLVLQQKLVDTTVKVAILSGQNKKAMTNIFGLGLVSSGEVISISHNTNDTETIKCPDIDKLITRAECLDYSGEEENSKDCQSCKNFNVTRKLLIPA